MSDHAHGTAPVTATSAAMDSAKRPRDAGDAGAPATAAEPAAKKVAPTPSAADAAGHATMGAINTTNGGGDGGPADAATVSSVVSGGVSGAAGAPVGVSDPVAEVAAVAGEGEEKVSPAAVSAAEVSAPQVSAAPPAAASSSSSSSSAVPPATEAVTGTGTGGDPTQNTGAAGNIAGNLLHGGEKKSYAKPLSSDLASADMTGESGPQPSRAVVARMLCRITNGVPRRVHLGVDANYQ